ncbi:zinc-binding dehydrogenase [Streptomyces sp. NPDC042319]|uniref:zinc-binding dehydrogenase n=1 Tax=Streptomyces sp. NPDC042319 TaxID=3154332 RepID=UPI0033C97F78
MRALMPAPDAPAGLALATVDAPEPRPDQVLVEVRHLSLNYGELHFLSRFPAGAIPGWDAAGVVVAAAANGSGPAVGTRVLTYGMGGAWAELRAVDLDELAVVPDSVDLARAVTLPVAGVTALRALRAAGPLLGRRVLITGASGGVGRFAVQLAALSGAQVIASVGAEQRGRGLAVLGADQVTVGLDGITEPVDVVLDTVGGPQMVAAYQLLAPEGTVLSIGCASGEAAVFPPYSTVGPGRSLVSFRIGNRLGADMAVLLHLLEQGRLSPEVAHHAPWEKAADAVDALFGRQLRGKAVLDVSAA